MGPKIKPLLTLCVVGLLSICATACGGGAHKATGSTSQVRSVANATNPTATATASSPKGDPDEDHDAVNPDEDDKGKPTPLDRDKDLDNKSGSYYDSDDKVTLDFGHTANASDTKAITALIKRYYVAAATENGAKACSMIYSTFAEAIPEDYGISPPGPPYARGTTCPAVMTLIFKHFHEEIVARLPKFKVSSVRLKGRRGLAVLNLGAMSPREIHVAREGHTWKVEGLLDNELS